MAARREPVEARIAAEVDDCMMRKVEAANGKHLLEL